MTIQEILKVISNVKDGNAVQIPSLIRVGSTDAQAAMYLLEFMSRPEIEAKTHEEVGEILRNMVWWYELLYSLTPNEAKWVALPKE